MNKDEQELSIGPKSFPVEPGKVQHFSLGSQQIEIPANDPVITVFVWLYLVGKDAGSCELLVACDKTGYVEMGKSKFYYAFADSTGPVCTSKMAYDLELVMTNFNENFHFTL